MLSSPVSARRTFLSDAIDVAAMGIRSMKSDEFSKCFQPTHYTAMHRSGILYIFSFIARYFILFPVRLAILLLGSTATATCFFYGIYTVNESIISLSFMLFFKLFVLAFNCHIKHHGNKQFLKVPHVFVSNHTSFIDFMILSSYKFCHACISENHGGLFGFVFHTIISRNGSISFKRSEKGDREEALRRIKAHIKKNQAPMLIFPEGTVVNNEYTVLFQKGAFDLDAVICPVGIKYKKKFMDPYWNRRVQCFTIHMFYLMTRWRIDVDVHWLDPVQRMPEESPIEFSHRVKNLISQSIGLKNTIWNGYFKSSLIIEDRILFKTAYKNTFAKCVDGGITKTKESDPFYLSDDNIYRNREDTRVYVRSLTYCAFVNECCKEYLRLKSCKALNIKKQVCVLENQL